MTSRKARDRAANQIHEAADHYTAMHAGLRWQVPARFNIAQACCARWASQPDSASRIAIVACAPDEADTPWSYGALQTAANQLSHRLAMLGVQSGDRVAIVLPQRFETAVAYMAVLQMGAVAMPLSTLFGSEALTFRLNDSGTVVALTDYLHGAALRDLQPHCATLRAVLDLTQPDHSASADPWPMTDTNADDPAVLIYTSGTTGNPKGALIPHRALIGNLSGFVCSQNWFGFNGLDNRETDAVFWSPADWAWTGGLMDALLPTLYFGRTIVAYRGRFAPSVALDLMQRHGVTHSFLFPTALKAIMKAFPGDGPGSVRRQWKLRLQAIMSAGEAVGDTVYDYCATQLGVTVNEMFGQTEINYIVGNCAMQAENLHARAALGWPARPGSMGKGYPGHRVAVIDDDGHECPDGVVGEVALHRRDVHGTPDPIFFLGYWNNPTGTAAKFTNDWCRTGDLARRDADGYLWYQGRADDMFKAAGYRIGPGEIENCLVRHPAVANAAVVPKPDTERGAVVKAYVVLAPDFVASRASHAGGPAAFEEQIREQLQHHVRQRLAPYEYPKEIEFIDELPMTTTGKVQRRVLRLQEEARYRAGG